MERDDIKIQNAGRLEAAIDLFDLIDSEAVEYDRVSYIVLLSVCSHDRLIDRGKVYFEKMLDQNVRPTQMHYTCMVDLLGRAGLLEEAEGLINCCETISML